MYSIAPSAFNLQAGRLGRASSQEDAFSAAPSATTADHAPIMPCPEDALVFRGGEREREKENLNALTLHLALSSSVDGHCWAGAN